MKEEIRLLLDQGARAAFKTVGSISDYEDEKDYHNVSSYLRVHFRYSPDDYEGWLEMFQTDKEQWEKGHITDDEWTKALQYARALYFMSYELDYPVEVICTATLEVRVGFEWVGLESDCIGGLELYEYPSESGFIYPVPVEKITHEYREQMVKNAIEKSLPKIREIVDEQEEMIEALKGLLND